MTMFPFTYFAYKFSCFSSTCTNSIKCKNHDNEWSITTHLSIFFVEVAILTLII